MEEDRKKVMGKSMAELYIDEIFSSLRAGHAAVLVGAGFSRNADPANEAVTEKIVMWNGLIDRFCDKLDICADDRKYLNTLKVAQEIEETYGRPFLDQMIQDILSDHSYRPSDIHESLLNLPWSDVFTTNYDTLLERACETLPDPERKYQIIRDQKDLIYSAGGSRLIKLHGSFPSNGPFIITEEDFRTYPNTHAPFINTVQQAMLENTFCLIGFSGDDPNFLKWIGWIHDNLGLQNSPIIYLITHTALKPAQIQYLSSKKIRVVVLEDVEKYRNPSILDANDYYKELYRAFLKDLNIRIKSKNEKKNSWPEKSEVYFDWADVSKEGIRNSLVNIHNSYPGWIFAPFKIHESVSYLIVKIEHLYIDKIKMINKDHYLSDNEKERFQEAVKKDAKLSEAENVILSLEIVFEYCWLHMIIGRPLSISTINEIAPYLQQYKNLSNTDKTKSSEDKWAYILLAELHAYRVNGVEKEWQDLYSDLKRMTLTSESGNSLIYEDIYHDIYTLKFDNIGAKADQIDTNHNRYVWALRKGCLWAMDGRYIEAANLIKDNLNSIRYSIGENKEGHDIRNSSIESCLVTLYNYVMNAQRMSFGSDKDQAIDFQQESPKDAEVDFIWDQENTRFADRLSAQYVFKPGTTVTKNFDIGSETTSIAITRDNKDLRLALEFVSFREMTGIPFRLSLVVYKDGVMGAVNRLAPYSLVYPIVLSTLVKDDKLIQDILSRKYLANISIDIVDALVDTCVQACSSAVKVVESLDNTYYKSKLVEFPLEVMPELISRLCTRCSSEKFPRLLELVRELFEKSELNSSISGIDSFVQRLIACMPLEQLLNHIEIFWKLPLVKNGSYPECFGYILNRWNDLVDRTQFDEETKNRHLKLPLNDSRRKKLQKLFDDSRERDYHTAAITRLIYLYKLYEWSDGEKKRLKEILLEPENVHDGRPFLGGYLSATLYDYLDEKSSLAQSEDGLSKTTVNNYDSNATMDSWLQSEWNRIIEDIKSACASGIFKDYSNELLNATCFVQRYKVTDHQIQELADVLLVLCNKLADFRSDKGRNAGFNTVISGNLSTAGSLLGEAILNAKLVDNKKKYVCNQVDEICKLLQANKIPCSLLGFCLSEPKNRTEVIIENLFNGEEAYASEAILTISRLCRNHISIGEEVKNLLISALVTNMGVKIYPYVQEIDFLLREDLLADEQLKRIDRSLPKYLELTAFDEYEDDNSVSEKIQLRQSVTNLAHTLIITAEKKGIIIKSAKNWKKDSSDCEEFAEIRNCWDEIPSDYKE